MENGTGFPVRRDYKDALFRMIFKEKENLLSLFNALYGTDYTDPELIEIVTLENAIYRNMKNDIAFVMNGELYMYEHQSTISPNMPERFLQYVTKEFAKMTARKSTYSTRKIKIPKPHFVVFYNGTEEDSANEILQLSDLYTGIGDDNELDLKVRKVNINLGKNDDLLSKCKPLSDYMQYISKVRTKAETMKLSQAVGQAVNESISEGILSDFLTKYKAEAIEMSIFEYDEEKELRLLKEEIREIAIEEGIEEGLKKGKELGLQKGKELGLKKGRELGLQKGKELGLQKGKELGLQQAITMCIEYQLKQGTVKEDIIALIQKMFNLTFDMAKEMVLSII
ncbi:RpnC/YadD family protein [[Clostridium] polysaccharolyticum]|uniref:Transposase (putative) YhgA-like domain-containing protein n=1 Tax=[Clostridium] polysaccharolyticum TaxID=29364 RepID=A0A1I0CJM5_9FIRM|nr:hypothetical protein [[Clostridium] polysaccharolyticum]SET19761.1 hypothetical protein SAMN04487772_11045 [[Clostridium] polysaccharolyticum]